MAVRGDLVGDYPGGEAAPAKLPVSPRDLLERGRRVGHVEPEYPSHSTPPYPLNDRCLPAMPVFKGPLFPASVVRRQNSSRRLPFGCFCSGCCGQVGSTGAPVVVVDRLSLFRRTHGVKPWCTALALEPPHLDAAWPTFIIGLVGPGRDRPHAGCSDDKVQPGCRDLPLT